MQAVKKTVMSRQGYADLEHELAERKEAIRFKIADDIEVARSQGDLSENAAYKSALEEKEFNENRISEIEEMLQNADVQEEVDGDHIGLGSNVMLTNVETSQKSSYTLVGQTEADPAVGKISIESPIGAALMDKKIGSLVRIELPTGEVTYKVERVD